MTELLRPELWNGHLFFVLRTFYAIERRRYDYRINAVPLDALFEELHGAANVSKSLDSIDFASIYLEHPDSYSLVSISRLMVSDLSWKSDQRAAMVNVTIGGKFWEARSDTIYNYFSVYDLEYDPARPAAERFSVRAFPEPQGHPHEEPNYLIAYASASSSYTHCKRGVLTHTISRSPSRLQFYLSLTGLDAEGKLYFANVNKEFQDYLAKNWSKTRVTVEEYTGALALLSLDSRTVDIWYPI